VRKRQTKMSDNVTLGLDYDNNEATLTSLATNNSSR
jgi:hypothetical protein